jgi:transposase
MYDSNNRTITRDPREYLMEYMRAKLNTEEGTEQYQKRMCTVEPVFGLMKHMRIQGISFEREKKDKN